MRSSINLTQMRLRIFDGRSRNKGTWRFRSTDGRHASYVPTRMTQQPADCPVASWWARRETSSADSRYRYPTSRDLSLSWPSCLLHGAELAPIYSKAAGSDCSPQMWQIRLLRHGTRICRCTLTKELVEGRPSRSASYTAVYIR